MVYYIHFLDWNRIRKDVQSTFVEILTKNVYWGKKGELNNNYVQKGEFYLKEITQVNLQFPNTLDTLHIIPNHYLYHT